MADYDLLIRGGSIVDGTGVPRFTADLGVRAGRIAKLGRIDPNAAERVIDADGLIVAPGSIDLHTHYDAQIQWDPWCTISGWHGITTVVMANCGFGFAPVAPADRELTMATMSRTEAVEVAAMREGMLWDWETVPEWLATLDRIPKGVNCLSFAAILPILYSAMGGRDAAKSRPPTAAEQAEIERLLADALSAGSCGWSLQRMGKWTAQTDFDGTPMASDLMPEEQLLALGRVLAKHGSGFVELFQGSERKLTDNLAVVEKLAEVSGRPILYNIVQAIEGHPNAHTRLTDWLEDCHRRGLPVYGQGITVRQPFHVTLEQWNLFDSSPAWNRAMQGSREEKMQNLRDPEQRAAMKADYDGGRIPLAVLGGPVEDYEIEGVLADAGDDPLIGRRLGDVAAERGLHPVDCLFDLSLETGLQTCFLTRSASGINPDHVAEMLASPYVVAGVSDGGAHAKFTVGGAYSTDLLEWLVRDEDRISAELAHSKLAWLPARLAGLHDRGALIEGMAADVIVYDPTRIRRSPDWRKVEVAHDQPAGEWRLVQRAEGYHHTIVNGEVTFEGNTCTGATPGRLLRND